VRGRLWAWRWVVVMRWAGCGAWRRCWWVSLGYWGVTSGDAVCGTLDGWGKVVGAVNEEAPVGVLGLAGRSARRSRAHTTGGMLSSHGTIKHRERDREHGGRQARVPAVSRLPREHTGGTQGAARWTRPGTGPHVRADEVCDVIFRQTRIVIVLFGGYVRALRSSAVG
jgi:hypothetical protein